MNKDGILRDCLNCGKELIGNERKYCPRKCRRKCNYLSNKSIQLSQAREWDDNNPEKAKAYRKKAMKKFLTEKRERFNELMRESYQRNKVRHDSRTRTYRILNGIGGCKKYNPLKKLCKKCGSKNKLEIHHEVYPPSTDEIKKAINEGKIYYVCIHCHGRGKKHIQNK